MTPTRDGGYLLPDALRNTLDYIQKHTTPIVSHPDDSARMQTAVQQLPGLLHIRTSTLVPPGTAYVINHEASTIPPLTGHDIVDMYHRMAPGPDTWTTHPAEPKGVTPMTSTPEQQPLTDPLAHLIANILEQRPNHQWLASTAGELADAIRYAIQQPQPVPAAGGTLTPEELDRFRRQWESRFPHDKLTNEDG